MTFQPLTNLSNPGTIKTGSFQPLSTSMSNNPGYVAPKIVQTPKVGSPLVNNVQKDLSGITNTISNVIKGVHFTFTQPTIQSPIPQSERINNTSQAPKQVQTPVIGKPLQPVSESSATLNTLNSAPNDNSTFNKIASALLTGGNEIKQNLIDLAMAFPANLTPENKQTPSEKRGLQLMQSLLFGGGGVSTEGTDTGVIANNIITKLTKDVTETTPLAKTFVVSAKDLQSLGNSGTNDLLKSLDLSSSELSNIRKASIGKENVNITIPSKTIIQVADKPWFAKLKTILKQSPSTSSFTMDRGAAQSQGLAGLLTDGENSPKDIINTVFKANAENTPEGKAIIKAASDAQTQSKNIIINKDENLNNLTVTHNGARTASEVQQGGLRFARNPSQLTGKAVYFSDSPETTENHGTNLQATINTKDFNLKVVPSLEEQQKYVDSLNAKDLADAIQKEGKYDGFIIPNTNKDVGNTVGITNLQKLNASIIKQVQADPNIQSNSDLLDTAKTFERNILSDNSPYTLNEEDSKSISQLFHADSFSTFSNEIHNLAQKYGGDFNEIDNAIKSGIINEKSYDSFKESYQTHSNLQSSINQVTGNSQAQENISKITSSESGNPSETSSNERAISGNQTSNSNVGNAEHSPITTESNWNSINTQGSESSSTSQRELGSTTLKVELIPGLSKFFEEDIIPKVKLAGEAAAQTNDILNPPRASEAAQKASNIVREALAKVENYQALVSGKYQNFRRYFSKYNDTQNIENISHYERTGQFLNEPKVKAGQPSYSQLYHDSMIDSYKIIRSAYGKDEEGFIENYVRRAFKFANTEEELKGTEALTNFQKSLSANKSPLKQRVLDMPLDEAFKDMVDRGIKVKMQTTNPEELRQWSLINAQKALAYKGAWNDLKASGLIKFVPKGGERPTGFVPLKDRAAEVFAPAEIYYGRGENVSETGQEGAVSIGRYYADPSVARIMNNAISTGLEENKLFKAARVLGNEMNSFQLGLSAFHLTGSALNAGFSDIALGLRNLLQGKPIKAGVNISRGIIPGLSFIKDIYHGQQFIQNLLKDDPETQKIMNEILNPAGGRIGRDARYEDQMFNKLSTALANGNYFGAALRIPGTIVETVAHPLMNYAIPRVKIGAFLDLAYNKLERLPKDATYNQKQIALSSAWNSIDNRFGQLVYNNLFWNKIGKDIAMLSTRSVGWNLGDLRELGGGMIKDPINTMLLGKDRINNNFAERFSDRMLFSIALIAGTATLGAVYQYLHTGQAPQELKDYFYPKDGGVDSNGNSTRRSLPTYWKDVYAFGTDPLATVGNKVSPGLATLLQLWQNRDYYGNLIRNPNDPTGTQLEQTGKYFLQNILPFSIQSATQDNQTLEQKLEGFLGITKAPARIVQSAQQQAAIKAYQEQTGIPGPKTPEQVEIQNLKTKAYSEIKSGMGKNSPSYRQLIKTGVLNTARKQQQFLKNAKLTGLQRMVSHLPKATRKNLGFK